MKMQNQDLATSLSGCRCQTGMQKTWMRLVLFFLSGGFAMAIVTQPVLAQNKLPQAVNQTSVMLKPVMPPKTLQPRMLNSVTRANPNGQPVVRQVAYPYSATGQNTPRLPGQSERSIRDYSWIYIEQPEPQEIKQHDIITILVDKKYQDRVNAKFARTRNSSLKAELKEFLRLTDAGNLGNASPNQPTIDTNLQGKISTSGAVSNQEGIQYRIAAIVVEVQPNGNLVLEARDRIEINGDVYVYTLTGVLPSDKVAQNMTANGENVYNLDVSKAMKGKVGDSVKRPWGVWLFDKAFPF